MSIQSTSNFIFNNIALQNGNNTTYQFTVDYEAATGKPYQFRSQTERMQALIGRQGMTNDYYQPNLYCRFYATSADLPSQFGPGNTGWGAEIGRAGAYPINFTTSFPGTTQTENVGIVAKGYIYSPVATTIRLQTVSDDAIAVYLNDLPVIQNWTLHAPTTDTSAQYPLSRGYTPIQIVFAQGKVSFVCSLFTNIGETGFNQNTGILFNSASSR
jgi:hypothetical protein